jgi:hypothetical protein
MIFEGGMVRSDDAISCDGSENISAVAKCKDILLAFRASEDVIPLACGRLTDGLSRKALPQGAQMMLAFGLIKRVGVGLVFWALAFTGPSWPWGAEGHSIVAEIAARHLTPKAAESIRQILGGNISLASIASWADDYRSLHPSTARWHFVDIPLDAQNYDEVRDCSAQSDGDCAIHAIERALHDLSDPAAPSSQRLDAVKFLVHFVGDIHQPLHTVAALRGYNQMNVCYFSGPAHNNCVPTDLHTVWDSGLIRSVFYDWGAYADFLETNWIAQNDIATVTAGTPIDWTLEAHTAARDVAVKGVQQNDSLGDDYLTGVRPTLDRQLAVAGLRLARLLNETFP